MTPFLQQVARHYIEAQRLEDYCFVFPNRRSGQFFTHYLQLELVAADVRNRVEVSHLMPRVTSINDLVAELTGTVAATDIEMMFALYDAYCQAMGDAAQEFDKFIYWAQLIISDFNDIDKSLADAHEVYQNLDDLHGLSSNYLSEEVQKKVREIFGDNLFTAFFDTRADAELWQRRSVETNNGEEGDQQVKREFMSLWNALEAIYHGYHQALDDKGVISSGRQLRRAAEDDMPQLPYTRLAFVGFGVLSAAEVKLFDKFKQAGNVDFWWDNAGIGAMLEKAPHDPGALLIDGYCKRFGAKELEPLSAERQQTIRAVAVPSTIGQAKVAFDEVRLMGGNASSAGIETAIVLPDEGLLVPLLHTVPPHTQLNVTLGYPLRSSSIVSLMHIVARLHHQATKDHGAWTFYREDVNDILSHPLIKSFFTDEAMSLADQLARTNRFRVPAAEFMDYGFKDLFIPAMDTNAAGDERAQQSDYLNHLLDFCNLLIDRMSRPIDDDEDNQETELPLQQAFLVMYIDVLNQLKGALAQCGQSIQRSSLFYLVDRLSASAIVPFTGEPLRGMQVMGLLETRSLDFERVVILSMNERIFPRHRSINSFIPNYIRRAHGMSTMEQQEAIVAFNFYRLLNRASHVSLVYDSSTQGLGTSEPSRYIAQLEKIYGIELEHVVMATDISTSDPIQINVPNRDRAMLSRYADDPENASGKYLSASAINKYINCPLMFYLHYIQGLNDDNEVSDFMDYGTFGTIIHDTLGDLYYSQASRERGGLFTADDIVFFKKNKLEAAVVRNIKKTFLHVPEDQLDSDTEPLTGEAFMLIDTIKSYVDFVLDYDIELIGLKGPFTILECEEPHNVPGMAIGGVKFNFTYRPDRIDRLSDGTVRIVDYKTGKDKTSFDSSPGLPSLFNPNDKDRRKAILQLFLYCYAYLAEHEDCQRVQPVIYKIASMKESGVICKRKKTEGGDFEYVFSMDDPVAQDFVTQMGATIRSLYETDFTQADEGAKACDYCRFIDFCRRTPVKR